MKRFIAVMSEILKELFEELITIEITQKQKTPNIINLIHKKKNRMTWGITDLYASSQTVENNNSLQTNSRNRQSSEKVKNYNEYGNIYYISYIKYNKGFD